MTDSQDPLIDEARSLLESAHDTASLANAKARFLGKEGALTARMKALASLSPQERAAAGKSLNLLKQAIEALVSQRQSELDQAELQARLAQEAIDVTLPGRGI